MSQTTFSPSAATQALLTQKTIPALDQIQYQQFADYLFSANSPLQLAVAETLFRYNRQHPRAHDLFLACAFPLADKTAKRLIIKMFPSQPDLTHELMYDGAVNQAIKMLHEQHQLTEEMNFARVLYRVLRSGAIRGFLGRMENTCILCLGSRDQQPRKSRLEEQLIAREMLEKLTNLEPSPETARLNNFLRCIILQIGPHDALRPYGKRGLIIDFEPVMEELGISRWTALQYLSQARKMLNQMFNADGTLFLRSR